MAACSGRYGGKIRAIEDSLSMANMGFLSLLTGWMKVEEAR
jgi:hypothetical protein